MVCTVLYVDIQIVEDITILQCCRSNAKARFLNLEPGPFSLSDHFCFHSDSLRSKACASGLVTSRCFHRTDEAECINIPVVDGLLTRDKGSV